MGSNSGLKTIIVLLLALLGGGCASVGADFSYKGPASLRLGQTNAADCSSMFGTPKSTTAKKTADGDFEEALYVHAYADMGTARARSLSLEFRNGLLNAYNFVSSFDEDKTNVNADGFKDIKRGQSTKADVLRLLGEPQGKALAPSENADFKEKLKKGAEAWGWTAIGKLSTFGHVYGGAQATTLSMYVVFDANGVVTDVEEANKQ